MSERDLAKMTDEERKAERVRRAMEWWALPRGPKPAEDDPEIAFIAECRAADVAEGRRLQAKVDAARIEELEGQIEYLEWDFHDRPGGEE